MSQTYRATGINLKSIPLGEADKILTILTREHGLIRAVAPGARKPKAKLGGRSELFVINDLLLSRGRSLDRLSQAESIESYPRLSRDLAKLTVSQYWAEVVLYLTPSNDPNAPLFDLFCQRLTHLVNCESGLPVLIHLVYGVMQFLSLAGVAPQVDCCCLSGQDLTPETLGNSRVLFSPEAGGVVLRKAEGLTAVKYNTEVSESEYLQFSQSPSASDERTLRPKPNLFRRNRSNLTLSASELLLIQQLALDNDLMTPPALSLATFDADATQWLNIEKALRFYVQYQTERPIRSATLLESCFNSSSFPAVSVAHP